MADRSSIEWTDATWNPITGCSVTSPGCTNCYAMALAGTRLRHHDSRAGLTVDTKAGPVWTGEVRFNDGWLTQPLRWRRPRRIFVCAHGDLFHESVPDAWIDRVFAVMALAPQHIRDQCVAAGVAFYFKQWGAWLPYRQWGSSEAAGAALWRKDWMILSADGDLDIPDDRTPDEEAGECAVLQVGKSRAGRLLDGVEHNGMPAIGATARAA